MVFSEPEIYTFTLPTCFARSILTTPWFELGGKVNLTNTKGDVQASVVFQTKPFYGGKLHHVIAEVKKNVGGNGPGGKIICKVIGEWNKSLEFTYDDGSLEMIDVPSIGNQFDINSQGSYQTWECQGIFLASCENLGKFMIF